MEYKLIDAKEKDIEILVRYKLQTILDYAHNINDKEKEKINNYVNSEIPKKLFNYKLIIVDGNIVGSFLIDKYKDGILLDEIFLEDKFRNLGIGSNIIYKTLLKNKIVYLWVYKENIKAINLYKKLGFLILEETETRYFMKYKNNHL